MAIPSLDDPALDAALVSASGRVLVAFRGSWCTRCDQLSPALEAIAAEHAGLIDVVEVDVEAAPRAAARLAVRSVPTLVLLADGLEVARVTGLVDAPAITSLLLAEGVAPPGSMGAAEAVLSGTAGLDDFAPEARLVHPEGVVSGREAVLAFLQATGDGGVVWGAPSPAGPHLKAVGRAALPDGTPLEARATFELAPAGTVVAIVVEMERA